MRQLCAHAEQCRQSSYHKQDVYKRQGFREFMPIHVEVLRDPLGKPYVELHEGAAKTAEDLGITKIEVSISDTKDHAMAFAVGEGEAG